jgi:hypothetical protein
MRNGVICAGGSLGVNTHCATHRSCQEKCLFSIRNTSDNHGGRRGRGGGAVVCPRSGFWGKNQNLKEANILNINIKNYNYFKMWRHPCFSIESSNSRAMRRNIFNRLNVIFLAALLGEKILAAVMLIMQKKKGISNSGFHSVLSEISKIYSEAEINWQICKPNGK